MRERTLPYFLAGGFHELAFTAWGDTQAPPVVCVHGLSRNAHDFDGLAAALSDQFYLLCPDLPGRGRSGWLPDPALYQPMSYVAALSHLLAFVDREVSWIGTSLGGICGMIVAAAPGNRLRRLVLNDIGPFVPKDALERIVEYVGSMPQFSSLDEAEAYVRRVHAPFGRLTDAQWRRMAETSVRRMADGSYALHYDPAMTKPLLENPVRDTQMWQYWDRIACPTLVLRGEESDLLLPDTLARMAEKAATHTVAQAGHAPALMDDPTIAVLREFLS